ncbi:MAG: hypothetical protein HRT61_11190 [Ekhidna sp.]|nr:hypothetical protein [Ekhidna sp.]
MKDTKFPIALTSSVLFVYCVFVVMNIAFPLIFFLFITVNALFVWMIIRILKDGKPSEKVFEEYFYEDFPHKRA